jgi:hypothetical protein
MRRSRPFPAKESSGFECLPLPPPHNHPQRPPAGKISHPVKKLCAPLLLILLRGGSIAKISALFSKTSPIENRDLPLFQPNTFATAPIFADRKKFKIFPDSSKALLGSSIDGGTKGSAAH